MKHKKIILIILLIFFVFLPVSLFIILSFIIPKTSFSPDLFLTQIESWNVQAKEKLKPYQISELTIIDNSYISLKLVNNTVLPPPNGIVIGSNNILYIAHNSTNKISCYDLNTRKIFTYASSEEKIFTPDDLTIDMKGNLYITCQRTGKIYCINSTGKITIIAKGLRGPNAIQFNNHTGRLFMTECFEGNRVFELDPAGIKIPKLLIKENVIGIPQGFDFDPETNDLIVPDMRKGKILRINPDTGNITTIARGFISAAALKIGPDKKIYIVEQSTGTIYRLTLDGKKQEKIAQLPIGLDNLAFTKNGKLFVTNEVYATIFEVNTDGSGYYKPIFPLGVGQPFDLIYMQGQLYMSDFSTIYGTNIEKRQWNPTKLSTHLKMDVPSFLTPATRTINVLMSLFDQATRKIPSPMGLVSDSDNMIIFSDAVSGIVTSGNPLTGKFKKIIKDLKFPTAMAINQAGTMLFVLEQAGNQIQKINLKDGYKEILTTETESLLPTLVVIKNFLYTGNSVTGEIIQIDITSSKKNIISNEKISRSYGLAHDFKDNLLVLDAIGQKLYRVNTNNMSIDTIATNIPISNELISANPRLERPLPITVSPQGDIFFTTKDRGLIMLKKDR